MMWKMDQWTNLLLCLLGCRIKQPACICGIAHCGVLLVKRFPPLCKNISCSKNLLGRLTCCTTFKKHFAFTNICHESYLTLPCFGRTWFWGLILLESTETQRHTSMMTVFMWHLSIFLYWFRLVHEFQRIRSKKAAKLSVQFVVFLWNVRVFLMCFH